MFKIKKDKYRQRFEILQDGIPDFTCQVSQFIDLSNAIVKYVVGKDYIISSPDRQATANGYGKYHFMKGFLLAMWQDIKKIFKREKDEVKS